MIDFFQSKREEALALGCDEVTVGVLNSYANELFRLGYDLIQPFASETPDSTGLTCRGGDFDFSISVSPAAGNPAPPSARVSLNLYKTKGGEQWSYSVSVGPGLVHFSQLLSSFPAVRPYG